MRTALFLTALASVAYSAPRPQLINLDAIALDFAPPELVKAPVNVQSNIPAASTPDAITPLQSVSAKKRELVEKRDGDCSPYPAGSGPVPSPDTPSAFQSDADFANMANNASTPYGYTLVFNNLGASLQASNYMGLYTLTSYDTLTCASMCDQASGCSAFNVYLERDPTVNANAQNCPNPPSTTNYKCTLWGAPVSSGEATNSGQYQDSFQVVIAGSNGYNKDSPPPSVSCYSGPQELGGAINAPPSSGSYMGYQYFPFSQSQGYDPQTCADACDAQTLYDSQHPAADGSFMSCVFFNAYVLSENAIPQGLYCSMYNETWDPSYGTNYGQYRGSDRYTVSESYSYTETCNNQNQLPVSSISSSIPVSSATLAASSTSTPYSSSAAASTSSSSAYTIVSSLGSSTTSPPTSSSSIVTSAATSASSSSSSIVSTIATSATSGSPSTASTIATSATSSSPSTVSTATTSATAACSSVGPVIQNGGFESGSLSPWVAKGTVGQSTSSIVSPGSTNAGGGNYAFSANLQLPTSPYGNGAVTQTLQQTLNTCAGTNYNISADYNFAYVYTGGTCSFTMESSQGRLVVSSQNSAHSRWHTASTNFQAISNADVVEFVLTCSTPGTIEVDSVTITTY